MELPALTVMSPIHSSTHTFTSESFSSTASSTLVPRFGNYLHVQRRGNIHNNVESEVMTLFSQSLGRLSSGTQTTCMVLSAGGIKCWGDGFYRTLGNGDDTGANAKVPVDVVGITNAVQVSVGKQQACALLANGSVKCWGYGIEGSLGNGTNDTSSTPVSMCLI